MYTHKRHGPEYSQQALLWYWGRLRKRKKSYAKTGLASRVVGVPLVTPAGLRLGLVENSVLCGDDPRSCTHRRCAHRQQSPVAASYGRC